MDLETRQVVRRFLHGHSGPLTDLAFTPDARRLFSASHDGTLRAWDLPTGRCVEWLNFQRDDDDEDDGDDDSLAEDGGGERAGTELHKIAPEPDGEGVERGTPPPAKRQRKLRVARKAR